MGILFNIRTLLFLLTGVTFANVGWNLGHFLTYDIGLSNLIPRPEPIFMGFVAFCLAFGFVLTELIVSHPFRSPWQNQNTLWAAIGFGIIGGIAVGLIYWAIDSPQFGRALFFSSWQGSTFRWLAWSLVGIATVLAESFAWKTTDKIDKVDKSPSNLKPSATNSTTGTTRSNTTQYKSSTKKFSDFQIRLGITIAASLLAAFIASWLFEFLRNHPVIISNPTTLTSVKKFESPIGLMVLGAWLGIAFSVCTSPTYVASLRAGAGFEFREGKESERGHIRPPLKFVRETPKRVGGKLVPKTNIEEGLTIQLLSRSLVGFVSSLLNGTISSRNDVMNQGILIGSSKDCHIQLDEVAPEICTIINQGNSYILERLNDNDSAKVAVNGKEISSSEPQVIKHNTIITLYATNQKDFYRFVYYNRFLDPFS